MGRHLVGKGMPTISLSAAQLVAAAGLTAVALPVGGLERVHIDTTPLIAVVVLGVLCTGITFHLTYRVIADEGATNAAVVGYLLPVVSVLLGAIVLAEEVSPRVALGMVVVLAGVGDGRGRSRASRRLRPLRTPLSARPLRSRGCAPPRSATHCSTCRKKRPSPWPAPAPRSTTPPPPPPSAPAAQAP